jgi:hypothetical protein
MRIRVLTVICTIILFFASARGFAQITGNGPPGPCPPTDPDCNDPAKAPITETVVLLLAGGIGLGIKAFSKKKK